MANTKPKSCPRDTNSFSPDGYSYTITYCGVDGCCGDAEAVTEPAPKPDYSKLTKKELVKALEEEVERAEDWKRCWDEADDRARAEKAHVSRLIDHSTKLQGQINERDAKLVEAGKKVVDLEASVHLLQRAHEGSCREISRKNDEMFDRIARETTHKVYPRLWWAWAPATFATVPLAIVFVGGILLWACSLGRVDNIAEIGNDALDEVWGWAFESRQVVTREAP